MFGNARKEDVQSVESLVRSVDSHVSDVRSRLGSQIGDVSHQLNQLCDALLPKVEEPESQVPMRTMRREEAKNFYGGGLYLIVWRQSPVLCC